MNTSYDLHVLGLPPAFVLSQDQTLMLTFAILGTATCPKTCPAPDREGPPDHHKALEDASIRTGVQAGTPPVCIFLHTTLSKSNILRRHGRSLPLIASRVSGVPLRTEGRGETSCPSTAPAGALYMHAPHPCQTLFDDFLRFFPGDKIHRHLPFSGKETCSQHLAGKTFSCAGRR